MHPAYYLLCVSSGIMGSACDFWPAKIKNSKTVFPTGPSSLAARPWGNVRWRVGTSSYLPCGDEFSLLFLCQPWKTPAPHPSLFTRLRLSTTGPTISLNPLPPCSRLPAFLFQRPNRMTPIPIATSSNTAIGTPTPIPALAPFDSPPAAVVTVTETTVVTVVLPAMCTDEDNDGDGDGDRTAASEAWKRTWTTDARTNPDPLIVVDPTRLVPVPENMARVRDDKVSAYSLRHPVMSSLDCRFADQEYELGASAVSLRVSVRRKIGVPGTAVSYCVNKRAHCVAARCGGRVAVGTQAWREEEAGRWCPACRKAFGCAGRRA